MKLGEISYNYKADVLVPLLVLLLHCNKTRVSLYIFLCGEFMDCFCSFRFPLPLYLATL